MTFALTSSTFAEGENIPIEYTCNGGDHSPELRWDQAPAQPRSFALIMHDPDAPNGDFTHWLLWDIPGTVTLLPTDGAEASGGTAGKNSYGRIGYSGPCPPLDGGAHRYYFELYALDLETLGLAASADRAAVEKAIQDHVLAHARLMGRCEYK